MYDIYNHIDFINKILFEKIDKKIKESPVDMCFEGHDEKELSSKRKYKKVSESMETKLGVLYEEIAKKYLNPRYEMITPEEYYEKPKSKIDYVLMDSKTKEIILLELKASKSTYNSSSKSSTRKKLSKAAEVLFLLFKYKDFKFQKVMGYWFENFVSKKDELSKRDTCNLIVGDPGFYDLFESFLRYDYKISEQTERHYEIFGSIPILK